MHKLEQIHAATNNGMLKNLSTFLHKPLSSIAYTGSTGLLVYMPNGSVLHVILQRGIGCELWVQSVVDTDLPCFSHKSMFQLPQNAFDIDTYRYLMKTSSAQDNTYIEYISNKAHINLIPWAYQRYQLNGGIISLWLELTHNSIAEHLLTQKHDLDHGLDALYKLLSTSPQYIEMFDVTNDVNFCDINHNMQYQLDLAMTKQFNLSNAELKIFKLIYSGLYKNKEVAYYAHLSTRTVEGLIIKLKDKLDCIHREQLFEKIKQLHPIIRMSAQFPHKNNH